MSSHWREPYFTDADGREWHVYDTVLRGGRHRPRALGSPTATHRVFVAEDRTRMMHLFGQGEPRDLEVAHLERQLRLAKAGAAWAGSFQPLRRTRR